jgi:hypothetical protein
MEKKNNDLSFCPTWLCLLPNFIVHFMALTAVRFGRVLSMIGYNSNNNYNSVISQLLFHHQVDISEENNNNIKQLEQLFLVTMVSLDIIALCVSISFSEKTSKILNICMLLLVLQMTMCLSIFSSLSLMSLFIFFAMPVMVVCVFTYQLRLMSLRQKTS